MQPVVGLQQQEQEPAVGLGHCELLKHKA